MGVGGAPADEEDADAAEENDVERTARKGGEAAICRRSEAADSSSGVRALPLLVVLFPVGFGPDAGVEVGGPTSAAVATGPRLRKGGCACAVRSGAKRVELGGEGRYAPLLLLLPLLLFLVLQVLVLATPRRGDADTRRVSDGGL